MHGLPKATTFGGISFVTTDPAPMTDLFPIVTPGRIVTFPPIQTSEPMVMGFALSSPLIRSCALIGCIAGTLIACVGYTMF